VEVLFNVFHQEPLALFRQAAAAGIGLIVKVPLDSGWLSANIAGIAVYGHPRPVVAGDHRAPRGTCGTVCRAVAGNPAGACRASILLAQPEVSL